MTRIRMRHSLVKAHPLGLQFVMVSECGNYELGIMPDKDGARIQGGIVGLDGMEIDWGFGKDEALVAITYHMILGHMEKFEPEQNPFEGLPYQSREEPAYKDYGFMQMIIDTLVTRKIAFDKIKILN